MAIGDLEPVFLLAYGFSSSYFRIFWLLTHHHWRGDLKVKSGLVKITNKLCFLTKQIKLRSNRLLNWENSLWIFRSECPKLVKSLTKFKLKIFKKILSAKTTCKNQTYVVRKTFLPTFISSHKSSLASSNIYFTTNTILDLVIFTTNLNLGKMQFLFL